MAFRGRKLNAWYDNKAPPVGGCEGVVNVGDFIVVGDGYEPELFRERGVYDGFGRHRCVGDIVGTPERVDVQVRSVELSAVG